MPTYVYKREDGSVFEIEQRITEDALEVCPTTGQKVKRVITGSAGLVFKGSGFYLTDYGKSGGNGSSKSESGSTSSDKKESKSEADSKSESKSSSEKSTSTTSKTE